MKPTASFSRSYSKKPVKKNLQGRSPESKKMAGRIVQMIQESTPSRIHSLLTDLTPDVQAELPEPDSLDSDVLDNLLDDVDPDMDDVDDDEIRIDTSFNEKTSLSDAVILESEGVKSATYETAVFTDYFELHIENEQCRFLDPGWHFQSTRRTKMFFEEFKKRLRFYETFADWLTRERREFLKSMDFWDYGPQKYSEILKKRNPTIQKDLPEILNLDTSQSAVSRYIRTALLCFPRGSMPVSYLFTAEAQWAWLAKAIAFFFTQSNICLDRNALVRFEKIKTPKSAAKRRALLNVNLDHLDRENAIRFLSILAGIPVVDSISSYADRILEFCKNHENIQ